MIHLPVLALIQGPGSDPGSDQPPALQKPRVSAGDPTDPPNPTIFRKIFSVGMVLPHGILSLLFYIFSLKWLDQLDQVDQARFSAALK